MGRELSYYALLAMDEGTKVRVHDLEYDETDQICTIHVKKEYRTIGRKGQEKKQEIIMGIILKNEEYIFEYTWNGKCENGEFKVYSIN